MHQALKDIYRLCIDTILPTRCVVCKKEREQSLCHECLNTLPANVKSHCIVCLAPSPYGLTHLPCKRGYTADRLSAIFDYTDKKVSQSIISGKYYFVRSVFAEYGTEIARRLAPEITELSVLDTVVTPLPLYSMRKRWRGFNQSSILAESFAKEIRFHHKETLMRNRYTRTQKNLQKAERLANVENCFSLLPGADVHGKIILLIDDVTTTGSTLAEATKVLKNNGANAVWCIALAQD